MRNTFKIACMTLVSLIVLDGLVAATLTWADRNERLGSLVWFFEYGRSVPGKLERWEQNPNTSGNLYDVGWRSSAVETSAAIFAEEPADTAPVIRSYGMSFTLRISQQFSELRSNINWDSHAGPAGPPNYTYALFQDDRANRREGDIAVLGVLSSVVPTMAAMSNQTRVFEQPAPLTYPIFRPDGDDGIIRIDPLVTSPAQQRALAQDPQAHAAWRDQLAREDAFYSPITFGLTWLDASPLARLSRRALAKSHINDTTAAIINEDVYPYQTVLPLMIRDFARTARADGQIPVVVLIQTNRPQDVDILTIAQPILDAENIPYLATVDVVDPKDPLNYAPDGHYSAEVDRLFAQRLIDQLGL